MVSKFSLFKKIDPCDHNVKTLEETEYDEFKVSSDDNISKIASNNSIDHSHIY